MNHILLLSLSLFFLFSYQTNESAALQAHFSYESQLLTNSTFWNLNFFYNISQFENSLNNLFENCNSLPRKIVEIMDLVKTTMEFDFQETYELHLDKRNFPDSVKFCRKQGIDCDLASFNTLDDYNNILAVLRKDASVYQIHLNHETYNSHIVQKDRRGFSNVLNNLTYLGQQKVTIQSCPKQYTITTRKDFTLCTLVQLNDTNNPDGFFHDEALDYCHNEHDSHLFDPKSAYEINNLPHYFTGNSFKKGYWMGPRYTKSSRPEIVECAYDSENKNNMFGRYQFTDRCMQYGSPLSAKAGAICQTEGHFPDQQLAPPSKTLKHKLYSDFLNLPGSLSYRMSTDTIVLKDQGFVLPSVCHCKTSTLLKTFDNTLKEQFLAKLRKLLASVAIKCATKLSPMLESPYISKEDDDDPDSDSEYDTEYDSGYESDYDNSRDINTEIPEKDDKSKREKRNIIIRQLFRSAFRSRLSLGRAAARNMALRRSFSRLSLVGKGRMTTRIGPGLGRQRSAYGFSRTQSMPNLGSKQVIKSSPHSKSLSSLDSSSISSSQNLFSIKGGSLKQSPSMNSITSRSSQSSFMSAAGSHKHGLSGSQKSLTSTNNPVQVTLNTKDAIVKPSLYAKSKKIVPSFKKVAYGTMGALVVGQTYIQVDSYITMKEQSLREKQYYAQIFNELENDEPDQPFLPYENIYNYAMTSSAIDTKDTPIPTNPIDLSNTLSSEYRMAFADQDRSKRDITSTMVKHIHDILSASIHLNSLNMLIDNLEVSFDAAVQDATEQFDIHNKMTDVLITKSYTDHTAIAAIKKAEKELPDSMAFMADDVGSILDSATTKAFLNDDLLTIQMSLPIINTRDIVYIYKAYPVPYRTRQNLTVIPRFESPYLGVNKEQNKYVPLDADMLLPCLKKDFFLCPTVSMYKASVPSCLYAHFKNNEIMASRHCEFHDASNTNFIKYLPNNVLYYHLLTPDKATITCQIEGSPIPHVTSHTIQGLGTLNIPNSCTVDVGNAFTAKNSLLQNETYPYNQTQYTVDTPNTFLDMPFTSLIERIVEPFNIQTDETLDLITSPLRSLAMAIYTIILIVILTILLIFIFIVRTHWVTLTTLFNFTHNCIRKSSNMNDGNSQREPSIDQNVPMPMITNSRLSDQLVLARQAELSLLNVSAPNLDNPQPMACSTPTPTRKINTTEVPTDYFDESLPTFSSSICGASAPTKSGSKAHQLRDEGPVITQRHKKTDVTADTEILAPLKLLKTQTPSDPLLDQTICKGCAQPITVNDSQCVCKSDSCIKCKTGYNCEQCPKLVAVPLFAAKRNHTNTTLSTEIKPKFVKRSTDV